MVHQGIDECSACMSRCRMYDHALRFVDDNDIIILIDDIEWNILRFDV